MSNQDSNKSFFQPKEALKKIIATIQIGSAIGSGLMSTTEQPQPENERQVSSSQVQSVPTEVDQLASIQEKEQEEKRQKSEDLLKANNQVIASGSPNPDSVEVVDNERQKLASTNTNFLQLSDEYDFESEYSESSENETETSNISTSVDLTEAFEGDDFESEYSESSENETETSNISTSVDLTEAFEGDDFESEYSESSESESETE